MTDTRHGGRTFLVIGYGNTLRSDDGVGPAVAGAIAALQLPQVDSISSHQLLLEHTEPISRAGAVVFVDAAVDVAGGVELVALTPDATTRVGAHTVDPRGLLALAAELYGFAPPAWWLKIPVQNLEFGETLSPLAQQGVRQAIQEVLALQSEPNAGA